MENDQPTGKTISITTTKETVTILEVINPIIIPLSHKVDRIVEKLTNIEYRFTRVEDKLTRVEDRVSTLEERNRIPPHRGFLTPLVTLDLDDQHEANSVFNQSFSNSKIDQFKKELEELQDQVEDPLLSQHSSRERISPPQQKPIENSLQKSGVTKAPVRMEFDFSNNSNQVKNRTNSKSHTFEIPLGNNSDLDAPKTLAEAFKNKKNSVLERLKSKEKKKKEKREIKLDKDELFQKRKQVKLRKYQSETKAK